MSVVGVARLVRAAGSAATELARLGDGVDVLSVSASQSASFYTDQPVTVTVHVTATKSVDDVAELFGLRGEIDKDEYYERTGDWPQMGIHVRVYGPPHKS